MIDPDTTRSAQDDELGESSRRQRAIDAYEQDAEVIARRAMAVAADICVFTNDRVTVEAI